VLSGQDVHITGWDTYNSGNTKAKYWKNGQATILPGAQATVFNMALSGTDVFVAGSVYPNAVYWKNGTAVPLGTSPRGSEAQSIVVNGADVYVAGVDTFDQGSFTKFWKNGTPTILSPPVSTGSTVKEFVTSLHVSGSDTYVGGGVEKTVAGETVYEPRFWKNGISVSTYDGKGAVRSISMYRGSLFVTVGQSIFKDDKIVATIPGDVFLSGHTLVEY
jgi:hypothetical protein